MSTIATTASAPRLRITPRGRAVVAVLLAVPLAAGTVAFGLGQGAAADGGVRTASVGASSFRYVTVGTGESLWSVAQRIAPSADPRDVVADLVEFNQLGSASVQAGERLAVPSQYAN
ncbi:MAG: LysM peptidoglycan-binding domain-containing protein [Micrococcales bacterium]|nr:LysM peptidoglycan-binding domain-containing protein [Micrococcales bacterium]